MNTTTAKPQHFVLWREKLPKKIHGRQSIGGNVNAPKQRKKKPTKVWTWDSLKLFDMIGCHNGKEKCLLEEPTHRFYCIELINL
jgi:hypothetical protein